MDLLDRLLDHDRWATATLLEASRRLADAQLDQPFDIGHGTLRATFDHLIANMPFWTGFMTGESAAALEAAYEGERDRSLPALAERFARDFDAFAALARRLRDEGRLDETFVDHHGVKKSMAGTVLMVVEHNVEHRAEIAHMLARVGVPEVPEVDHGVWDYRLHNS